MPSLLGVIAGRRLFRNLFASRFINFGVVNVSLWDGRVGIDYGVYGVPETFLVGRDGKIAYKLVGPITPGNLEAVLKPEIEKALAAR